MFNNYDAAILGKLNVIAEQYGLQPHEFEAITFPVDVEEGKSAWQSIRFTKSPPEYKSEVKYAAFCRMFRELGGNLEQWPLEVRQTKVELNATLENALVRAMARSPKQGHGR